MADGWKGWGIFSLILLIAIAVIFVVLLATGNLTLGKINGPTPQDIVAALQGGFKVTAVDPVNNINYATTITLNKSNTIGLSIGLNSQASVGGIAVQDIGGDVMLFTLNNQPTAPGATAPGINYKISDTGRIPNPVININPQMEVNSGTLQLLGQNRQ